MTHPITVIGTGLAGYTLARELRKLNKTLPLRIISADAGDFYSKPMLSNGLASNKTAAQLAMKSAAKMAEELNAEVLPFTRVQSVDRAGHLVNTDQASLPYSQLVLAVGADVFDIGLQGDAASEVLHVNDLADYARFRERIAGKRKIVLLGSGLIGCEFANDLLSAGYQVDVVDLAQWPLSRLLPEPAARFLQARLEALGTTFHFGVKPLAVDRAEPAYRVSLSDGSALEADIVLSAIGLRPRLGLAAQAGIATARGVVVDRYLRSSDADVYALGDCAEVGGLVLPYVLPIMQAARALASTLAGTPTQVVYPAMPVVVKTPACPLVVSPPAIGAAGAWQLESDAEGITAKFLADDGQLLGFALLGNATAQKQLLTSSLPAVLA